MLNTKYIRLLNWFQTQMNSIPIKINLRHASFQFH